MSSNTTAAAPRSSRKVILISAAVIGVFLILALAFAIIPRIRQAKLLAAQEKQHATTPPNVFVMKVQPSSASIDLQLTGSMAAITEAPILAQVDGYLKNRLVDIGDRVQAGQLLGVIAAPALDQQTQQARELLAGSQATLVQTEAALDESKANAGLAKVTAERWAALLRRGAVSQQASDNYQYAYDAETAAVNVAAANVAAAKNSVGSNQANVSRYVATQNFENVVAPFTGVITARNVDTGALITSSSTLLYRVAKYDKLRTYIDVPQEHAPSLKIGNTALISVIDYPNRIFPGKVTRSSNSLNLNTRTLLTEVDICNDKGALMPGMYATVKFVMPRTIASVIVPEESMMFLAKGTVVTVVDDQQTIHFLKVVLGTDYGTTLEILSGLKSGQMVVVNPNSNAVEGAKVNPIVVPNAPATMSAATSKKEKS